MPLRRLKAAATLSIVVLRVSFSMLCWFIWSFRLGVKWLCHAVACGGFGTVEGDLWLWLLVVEGHGLPADGEVAVPVEGEFGATGRRDRQQAPVGVEHDLRGENSFAEVRECVRISAADNADPASAAAR
ncbi:hypothetical protein D3C71_1680550 [compost metagenome]